MLERGVEIMLKEKEAKLAESSTVQQVAGSTQAASSSSASSGVALPPPAPVPVVDLRVLQTPKPPPQSGNPLAPQFFAGRIIHKG
eukprot:111758-Alexandrium_andersonii.AAC.1